MYLASVHLNFSLSPSSSKYIANHSTFPAGQSHHLIFTQAVFTWQYNLVEKRALWELQNIV